MIANGALLDGGPSSSSQGASQAGPG
jgi:hypothetical protein